MQKPLVLIVEDHAALAMLYQKAFAAADYETEVFYDGDRASARLKIATPAIVILDLRVPYVSGRALLTQIRDDGRLAQTLVLLVSSYVHASDQVLEQVDFTLQKPISYLQLYQLAERLRPTVEG